MKDKEVMINFTGGLYHKLIPTEQIKGGDNKQISIVYCLICLYHYVPMLCSLINSCLKSSSTGISDHLSSEPRMGRYTVTWMIT